MGGVRCQRFGRQAQPEQRKRHRLGGLEGRQAGEPDRTLAGRQDDPAGGELRGRPPTVEGDSRRLSGQIEAGDRDGQADRDPDADSRWAQHAAGDEVGRGIRRASAALARVPGTPRAPRKPRDPETHDDEHDRVGEGVVVVVRQSADHLRQPAGRDGQRDDRPGK